MIFVNFFLLIVVHIFFLVLLHYYYSWSLPGALSQCFCQSHYRFHYFHLFILNSHSVFVSPSLSFSLSIFLFSFISYFSTEKVPKIDRLLGKYKGREEEFLRFVYQKYGNCIIIISLSIFLTARPVANKYYSDVIPNFSPALSWIYYCLPYLYFFLLYPLSYLLWPSTLSFSYPLITLSCTQVFHHHRVVLHLHEHRSLQREIKS